MKLRIIHGVTREESKGSNLILYALEMIKENYGEQVSITIVERLPYEDYLRVLEVNDILVDQCKSYSYGMNALIAMSMGLVVLSGSEPEAMSYLGVEECPVINITPDTMQIYSALAKLIDDKQSVYDISKRSVSYVVKYHDAEKIALAFELVYQKATESNDV